MSRFHFLFPGDPLEPRSVEAKFADERAAFEAAGFSTSLVSDEVLSGESPLPRLPDGCVAVYRGWMLSADQYGSLVRAIAQRGGTPLTSPIAYLVTHHLPNWYPLVSADTPETRVYPADADIVAELRSLGWGRCFVKDYVKSLKTGRGAIVESPEQAPALLDEMRQYRGEIEGGICVRRVEDFVRDTERRYFVLFGQPFAADPPSAIPDAVAHCASQIPSRFYFYCIEATDRR